MFLFHFVSPHLLKIYFERFDVMPVFFCCIVVLILWLHYESKKSSRIEKEETDSFWVKERDASFTRKSDISNLDYIGIPLNQLPLHETEDEALSDYHDKIKELSTKKIFNLNNLSNTDVKIKYGVGNFEELATYDQNYTILVRTLAKWGTYLYESGNLDEAQIVLEYGITCYTDVSENYTTLAQVYKTKNDITSLTKLLEKANQLDSIMKPKIIKSITTIINQY